MEMMLCNDVVIHIFYTTTFYHKYNYNEIKIKIRSARLTGAKKSTNQGCCELVTSSLSKWSGLRVVTNVETLSRANDVSSALLTRPTQFHVCE